MLNAILYKEWLKTYKTILIFFILFFLVVLYTFIDAKNTLEFGEATTAILGITVKGRYSYNWLDVLSIAFAVLLALFQYYLEIKDGRIRLYLHLPLKHTMLIATMIFSGILVLLLIFHLVSLGYYSILTYYYPEELFWAIFSKMIPMFLVAIFAYLSTALLIVEPDKIKKIGFGIISILIYLTYSKYTGIGYFSSRLLDMIMILVITIYIAALFHAFRSYTKGYAQ